MIIEYLNAYEPIIVGPSGQWSDAFNRARSELRAVGNFQLTKLGLVAAYIIRSNSNDNNADWKKGEKLLTEIAEDYDYSNIGWKNDTYASPIYAQMLAQIASWQWSKIKPELKSKVEQIATEVANYSLTIDPKTVLSTADDSKAEEFAWFASDLGFTADMFPNNPNSSIWAEKAQYLACNATSSLTTNGKYSCEVSQSLSPKFELANHAIRNNASYGLTVPWGFAQATLFKLNKGLPIPIEYRKNLLELYNANTNKLVIKSTYTYTVDSLTTKQDGIIACTGRDDWRQDATLQDSSWVYLDKVLGMSNANDVLNMAWLSRGGTTPYSPLPIDNIGHEWKIDVFQEVDCGKCGKCYQYSDHSALHLFLNGMDAIDRFVSLFITDPGKYKLTTVSASQTIAITPASIPKSISDNFENGLSQWKIDGGGVSTEVDASDKGRHTLLKVSYAGKNQDILISRIIPNDLSKWPKTNYGIEVWDDVNTQYGMGFYVMNQQSKDYLMLVLDNSRSKNYLVRQNDKYFDSGIPRSTNSWHKILITVLPSGSYISIDGQKLSNVPVLTRLTSVDTVAIEYPAWNKPLNYSYWDNFSATPLQ